VCAPGLTLCIKEGLKQGKAWHTFDAENEKNGKNRIDNLASGFSTHTAPNTARIQPDFKIKQGHIVLVHVLLQAKLALQCKLV
jgi:hypothetical protein